MSFVFESLPFLFFELRWIAKQFFNAQILQLPLLCAKWLAIFRHQPVDFRRLGLARGKELPLAVFLKKLAVTPQRFIVLLRFGLMLQDVANDRSQGWISLDRGGRGQTRFVFTQR